MSTNYPTTVDAFATVATRTRPYASLFENISAATNAIETVVGYGDAAPYIMYIGDSVTEGSGNDAPTIVPGGYREKLYQLVWSNGVVLQALGALENNPAPGQIYPNHAGYSGQDTASMLSTHIPAQANTPEPKYVILNIGNNDVKNNTNLGTFNDRYDDILALIATKWPNCKIICMTLGPFGDTVYANYAYMNADAVAPNTHILTVGDTGTYADRIAVVDTASIIPISQTGDGLHWAAAGYQTMAEAIYYNALVRIL